VQKLHLSNTYKNSGHKTAVFVFASFACNTLPIPTAHRVEGMGTPVH
jgi:hypothetical protein